ncbi:type I restriction endonuclease [Sphingomonas sp. MMS24-JH45]
MLKCLKPSPRPVTAFSQADVRRTARPRCRSAGGMIRTPHTRLMAKLTESVVEDAALAWLAEQGWQVAYGIDASPDGKAPERAANSDVILTARLSAAVDRLAEPAHPRRRAR